jgi:hypothetical protein
VPAKSTDCQSVEKCGSAGFFGTPVRDLCAKFSAHSVHERACCTISTSTLPSLWGIAHLSQECNASTALQRLNA